tara:strand:+ start:1507 stop:1770 length:264 start_codon:yes stop_codon:yes gene_type:complete
MSFDTPTEEEIAAHFTAMDHSVKLINATVADDSKALTTMDADEVKVMITRNTGHLEVQATKDWYIASSNNKTSYNNAVAAGKAYVAA